MTLARVLVIEDHTLLAQTLAAVLGSRGVDVDVAPATDQASLLAAGCADRLAVLDLQLAQGQDGSLLVAPLRAAGAQVVVLSGTRDLDAIGRALDAGAIEVLDKAQSFDQVLAAITAALAGTGPADPARLAELRIAVRRWRSERDQAAAVLGRLTPREHEVLDELAHGRTVDEVAEASRVSPTTVRSQVASVLSKLGVHSQLTAVARARRLRGVLASHGAPHHPAHDGRRPEPDPQD